MYPSFEELRSERQRIVFSNHFKRLCWPLRGTFPTALSVMATARGALDEMEPLQRQDGSWHEIATLSLTEPKVSSVNASVFILNQYEADWVVMHEYHETAEYVTYGDLDDETRPFGEQQEDGTWEADADTEYLARCCGQDRPVRKKDLKVQVKATSNKFLTIQDYVSGVLRPILNCVKAN
ncbi:hypothetical protein CCM_04497 [Cordyceps militaris CM01]|uniref:Uncharacterized protein n=1 Tax=Cordyceps militaris (strain CM01) TaxID=983644 RepID=G3JFD5_CORMM|nr:uncharacterized protein CCM_04497 [Cordyceps militaris CM01]EGX93125.1 hypothetical protein CCM_04497 [Cordyceps militaris CM01]